MTLDEYRTMFALWCLVKSPLMLGSDLTLMTKESDAYKIITNKRLLAINQDHLGKYYFLQIKGVKYVRKQKINIT